VHYDLNEIMQIDLFEIANAKYIPLLLIIITNIIYFLKLTTLFLPFS